jgi:hypothetical protein
MQLVQEVGGSHLQTLIWTLVGAVPRVSCVCFGTRLTVATHIRRFAKNPIYSHDM